jgi:hypothetical protein
VVPFVVGVETVCMHRWWVLFRVKARIKLDDMEPPQVILEMTHKIDRVSV